jgi:hypothetical protein
MTIRRLVSSLVIAFLAGAPALAARDAVGNARLMATTPSILNEILSITLTGAPNARFILAGDFSPGPRNTPFGPVCLGLTNRMRLFNDSIRGSGALLDGSGRFTLTARVPDQPSLLGLRFYLQGFVRDAAAPMSLAKSNGLTLLVSTHGTNLFSPGSLVEARALHTATRLDDHRVLVAGGGSGSLLAPVGSSTSELYDVHTKTSASTGSLSGARAFHTATRLSDGRVLVTGGVDAGGAVLATAEIYDPASGAWSLTASPMSVARAGHTATLLGDGRVLVAGGTSSVADTASTFSNISNTGEIFDPATTSFSPAANVMSRRRLAHAATLLANGDVLLTGGFDGLSFFGTPTITAVAEVFHPAGANFNRTSGAQSVGDLRTARAAHSATRLADDRVLLAGGATGVLVTATSSAEIFSPATGSFANTGSLPEAKAGHAAVLLQSGEVFVAGGLSGSLASPTSLSSCALFTGASFAATGALNTPRGSNTATLLPNGTVLTLGGADDSGALATGEIYAR